MTEETSRQLPEDIWQLTPEPLPLHDAKGNDASIVVYHQLKNGKISSHFFRTYGIEDGGRSSGINQIDGPSQSYEEPLKEITWWNELKGLLPLDTLTLHIVDGKPIAWETGEAFNERLASKQASS